MFPVWGQHATVETQFFIPRQIGNQPRYVSIFQCACFLARGCPWPYWPFRAVGRSENPKGEVKFRYSEKVYDATK